jgi:hypothetical protein
MNEIRTLQPAVDKAFSFAQEAVKQTTTLATAIFTLTLTFQKDIAPKGTDTTLLEVAWFAYLVSVLFGIFTLMNLAGQLEKSSQPSIYAGGIKGCGIVHSLCFVVGLVLTLLYGLKAT